jgi:phosphinothricin acetyltransferase
MRIEDATDDDLPAVVAIYNEVIRTSTAIYREEPATLEERRAWNDTRKTNGYPLLVARTDDAAVAGFATFGDFRAWPGYRFTVEHSVHVAEGQRGRGIGTALMRVLLERGTALGKHVMVAGIDADNAGSIRMHERLGFEATGHLTQVGWKFGRWLDLVFMQRQL